MAAAIANTHVLGFNWDTTASLGIASYPNHGTTIEAVMRCADNALYQAKKDGRNCVRPAPVIPPAAAAALTRGAPRTHSARETGLTYDLPCRG